MNKTKLLEIAQALDLGSIDDKKARTLLLGLLGVGGMLPTDEELDNAAIEFVNDHCDNLSGDLTQETECFDAGAVWMRERLLGNYR